jgi:hypothetical protein
MLTRYSILLFASGIPPAERSQARKFHVLNSTESGTASTPSIVRNATGSHQTPWERYKYYLSSTSVLFPIPPVLYRPLPLLVKSTVLLDFPMYRRFETEDGEQEVILV